MFKKSLLFMLLLALFMPLAMRAQESIPYNEGFESMTSVDDLTAAGWTLSTTESGTFLAIETGASNVYEGSKSLNLDAWNASSSSSVQYLGLPLVAEDLNTLQISFAYKVTSGTINVGYLTDATDFSTFTSLAQYTSSSSFVVKTTDLSEAPKDAARLVLKYTGWYRCYLDSFEVKELPSCQAATSITASDITATSATIAWEGEGDTWNLKYNGIEVNGISAMSYNLTNLTSGTNYTVSVQNVCSDGTTTDWISTTFSTLEVCPDGMVCIGSGTATSTYLPANNYYNYSLTQQIYTAAEIGEAGAILSIDFFKAATTTMVKDLDIYMVSTTKDEFESTTDFVPVTSSDLVFSGTVTFADNAWTTIELDNPFVYDGTSNVAIMVDNNTGAYESSTPFYVFTSDKNQALYAQSDGTNFDPFAPSFSSRTAQKNRIRLAIGEPPTCPKPTGLAVSNIGPYTAELSWNENGSATEWVIWADEKESVADSNPFVLTELEPETEYTVKVRANCGDNDLSDWSNEVTFTTDVACPAPTDLTMSDIQPTSATASWTGFANSYNLRYRELTEADFATIIFIADDVWQDGSGYQLLMDADATAYGTIIPETGGLTTSGNASAATYAEFEYKLPENADGAMSTTNVLVGETASIQVPPGTFDWCVTNPTPGDRIWIAGNGRYDDYVFESGYTYEFHVQSNGDGGDDVVVTVTETGTKGQPKAAEWTEINGVTSPNTITVEGGKDYILQVQANCGDEGTSDWASTSFQTPSNCQVPTPLDVTDLEAYSATLNWTGVQDSYQVQYRTQGSRELLFFESFDNQPSTWTLTNAVYNRTSSQTTDYFVFLGSGYTDAAYVITPELTGFENGGTLEFMHRAYSGTPTFKVGFSSTTNEVDAFTWGSEVAAASPLFGSYSVAVPNGTKYIAITTTTETSDCCVLINDFGIYGNEIPAGSWNTATANTTSCPITGLTANTKYEWQVRGVNNTCDGGYTEWSTMATFTTEPSCLVPTDLDYQLEDDYAVLSWNSNANLFDIKVNETVIEGVTNPYNLALDPETIYYVSVRANCGDGDLSDWTDEIAFVSNCSGVKDLPYTYGFENNAEYYACWYGNSSNTENSCGITSYDSSYEGSYAFLFSSYNSSSTSTYDQYLISPELNAENEMTVEFYYRTPSGYGSETFKVGYSTDGSEFTWGEEISTNTTEWTQYLDTVPAGTKYVAIHYYSNYQYYLLIDGFSFQEVASATITQTIDLVSGYNTVSFNVNATLDEIKAALLVAFDSADGIKIIAQNGSSSTYVANRNLWRGNITEWDSTQGLTVYAPAATTNDFTLEGESLANTAISLAPGYNLITFTGDVETPFATAIAGFVPVNGDMIIAPDGNSATYNSTNNSWRGRLSNQNLKPGVGYTIFNADSATRSITFQSGSKANRATTNNVNKIFKTTKNFQGLAKSINDPNQKCKAVKGENNNHFKNIKK